MTYVLGVIDAFFGVGFMVTAIALAVDRAHIRDLMTRVQTQERYIQHLLGGFHEHE